MQQQQYSLGQQTGFGGPYEVPQPHFIPSLMQPKPLAPVQ